MSVTSAIRLGPDIRRAAVVVAHPDDETLWCGGLMLLHPQVAWEIVALCRGDDSDRAPRFAAACGLYGANCSIGELDDGPEQYPLAPELVGGAVLSLLSRRRYDLLLTHGPNGEYSRHLRHEEASSAVTALLEGGGLEAGLALAFSYDDLSGSTHPLARTDAEFIVNLPENVYERKLCVITEIYGFSPGGFEHRAAGRVEAFDTIRLSRRS